MMMNNNTLLEICVNSINYDKSLYISRIIWYVCGFIGVIVGIPGHIFQIIISSNKTNRKQLTSIYFISIAICELVFLLGLYELYICLIRHYN
jgi:F0F1-type ATP synthase membrane subunit c/vacuolar-type H+-ATPase subunit K